jgi:DinB superfamily
MADDATVQLLRDVYAGPAWHGPSVKEALGGVTASVAARRLTPDRNSIWELVLHLAHGRHLVAGRVTNTTADFPRRIRTPWWPIIDYELTDTAWRDDLRLLDECQDRLIDVASRATPAQLARIPEGATQSVADQLLGMAVHDGYHAGQIRQLALHFARDDFGGENV